MLSRPKTEEMRAYRPSSRPISEMDQLASLSRSGGHAPNEDALLDFKVQEKFRAHIEDKVSCLVCRNHLGSSRRSWEKKGLRS